MNKEQRINELMELYNLPVNELIEISSKITQENFKNNEVAQKQVNAKKIANIVPRADIIKQKSLFIL